MDNWLIKFYLDNYTSSLKTNRGYGYCREYWETLANLGIKTKRRTNQSSDFTTCLSEIDKAV